MQAMSIKQRKILDRLIEVSNGDASLLDRGLHQCTTHGNINLAELVEYLIKYRK